LWMTQEEDPQVLFRRERDCFISMRDEIVSLTAGLPKRVSRRSMSMALYP
jgi:hypothetical protein